MRNTMLVVAAILVVITLWLNKNEKKNNIKKINKHIMVVLNEIFIFTSSSK